MFNELTDNELMDIDGGLLGLTTVGLVKLGVAVIIGIGGLGVIHGCNDAASEAHNKN